MTPRLTQAEAFNLGRSKILDAVDSIAPGIRGNPWIPEWPTPRQLLFLSLHRMVPDTGRVFEALYGGAAGGGKSSALLMTLAQMAWLYPEFSGIAFRRSYTDLTQPGALLDRAMQWWIPRGAEWNGTTRKFKFPNGSQISMSYLWGPTDHLRYQGAEYHATAWDELTQWATPSQYEYVGLSRVRRREGSRVPLRTMATSNPGGPGHDWVRRRFVGGYDQQEGGQVAAEHYYVPARLTDNPHLDTDTYAAGLQSLHPTVREQLLAGDWDARDPGDYFRSEWFGQLIDPDSYSPPAEAQRIRWWDLAASERPEAARTAGVRIARLPSGVRVVEHAKAFRATPGSRDDAIVQTAQADGRGVTVGIEIEGGSGGLAQFLNLERRLKAQGYRVVGARPTSDLKDRERNVLLRQSDRRASKAMRADPVASCLERGYIRRGEGGAEDSPMFGLDRDMPLHRQRDGVRCLSGSWSQAYLDELIGFPAGHLCDLVDATSGAWSWLEANPYSRQPSLPHTKPSAKMMDVDQHPDDRRDKSSRSSPMRPL